MKISCPSCGASFNIKSEALGAAGRKVKCGKCAHQWHAMPDGAVATAEETMLAPPPAPEPPRPAAEAAPAQTPSDFAADFAAEMAAKQAPGPEPPAAPTDDAPEPAPVSDAAETDFDPFPKLEIPAALTDTEDDEPAPEIAVESSAPPSSEAKAPKAAGRGRRIARGLLMTTLTAAAVAIIVVGGAIFLQPQITSFVPASASLYAQMGLRSDIPGLGLNIDEPKTRKIPEGDDQILAIVGVIRNATKDSMHIPMMQARLLDGDGEPLNVWLFRATKTKIAAGGTVEYKTEFRNPPSKAETLDITFTSQKPAMGDVPDLARKPTPDLKKSSDIKKMTKPAK